jgi:hypothetical protein
MTVSAQQGTIDEQTGANVAAEFELEVLEDPN